MEIYELKVGRTEPRLFDSPYDALEEGRAQFRKGNRVTLFRKRYDGGYRTYSKRMSIRAYSNMMAWLAKRCKRKGYTHVRVVAVRRCYGKVDEDILYGPKRVCGDSLSSVACLLTDYEPTSELIIDDSSFSIAFYDAFYVRQVWVSKGLFDQWTLLYETPQAEPKPHYMDY